MQLSRISMATVESCRLVDWHVDEGGIELVVEFEPLRLTGRFLKVSTFADTETGGLWEYRVGLDGKGGGATFDPEGSAASVLDRLLLTNHVLASVDETYRENAGVDQ